MEYYILDLCTSFRCLAGQCPHTCCSGWAIEVAKEDYIRFSGLEPAWLRKQLMDNVVERNGRYYIKNQENGDCAMLEQDGLCLIQRHTSEEMLCNTCRKFPRIYQVLDDITAFSMAASCPVTAHMICRDALHLMYGTAADELLQISFWDVPFCKRILELQQEFSSQQPLSKRDMDRTWGMMFEAFTELILDCLCSSSTSLKEEMLEYLSFFEEERTDKEWMDNVCQFRRRWEKRFFEIKDAYVPYRSYSRWLERPEEGPVENYCQVCGELVSLFYFAFLRANRGELEEDDWERVITFSYRFFVHEREIGTKLHDTFVSWYTEDSMVFGRLLGEWTNL